MKNTLEHLKKAYGKELLNGINHSKLSNYPFDFLIFFFFISNTDWPKVLQLCEAMAVGTVRANLQGEPQPRGAPNQGWVCWEPHVSLFMAQKNNTYIRLK